MAKPFMRVTLTSTKGQTTTRFVRNLVSETHFEVQEMLLEATEQTRDRMRQIIQEAKKRASTGNNLEKSIDVEILNTEAGFAAGIGNINRLESDAPYYMVLNDGGYVPYSTVKGAPLGSFEGEAPSKEFYMLPGNAAWERSGSKGFFMKPQTPIEGIDYIGIAERELRDKIIKETREVIIRVNNSSSIGLGTKYIAKWNKRVTFGGNNL